MGDDGKKASGDARYAGLVKGALEPRQVLGGRPALGSSHARFLFLLRASEYLDTGYRTPGRGLQGRHVQLQQDGKPWNVRMKGKPDEVVLTDICNNGETRIHFRADEPRAGGQTLCVVQSVAWLFHHFPDRAPGEVNQDIPILTEVDGSLLTRMAMQNILQMAAKSLGFNEARLGSHSLRFGGASALWAAYHDSALVRRWGRWASDAFQGYIWEGRQGSAGVAQSMAKADLTPS